MNNEHIVDFISAHFQSIIRRLVWAIIICVIVLLLTNAAWLYAWMQYDYTSEAVEIESENGIANYIGNDGDIINGTDSSAKTNP